LFSSGFSQFHRAILERQHEQKPDLVLDVFTFTKLADYVRDCKSGRSFRQWVCQFAGNVDEANAEHGFTISSRLINRSISFMVRVS
jgi:hypothetical protein